MNTCRRCGADIRERFIGPTRVWAHLRPSLDLQHPPMPKVAPPSESELRALAGDR